MEGAGYRAKGLGEIRIPLPKEGMCPVCWGQHRRGAAHEIGSIYYLNQFYRRYGHFPEPGETERK